MRTAKAAITAVSRKRAWQIVTRLVEQQRPMAAILATLMAIMVLAFGWKLFDNHFANSYALFLPAGSVVIGLCVRYAGRGITTPFRIIGLLGFVTLCALMLLFLGIRISDTVLMIVPAILFIGGLVLCGWLTRRVLDEQQEVAYWKIFVAGREQPEGHSPWLAIPIAVTLFALTIPIVVEITEATGVTRFASADHAAEQAARAFIDSPDFAERARRLGRPLGYESTAQFCHEVTTKRLATCSDIVCEAQNPYILEGCLETAGTTMDDEY